jgi:hypothetical protein
MLVLVLERRVVTLTSTPVLAQAMAAMPRLLLVQAHYQAATLQSARRRRKVGAVACRLQLVPELLHRVLSRC